MESFVEKGENMPDLKKEMLDRGIAGVEHKP